MAVVAALVAVGTTATLLTSTDGDRSAGSRLHINNTSGATLFLGGAAVTTVTGYPLVAGAVLSSLVLGEGEDLYAVVAVGVSIPVLRVGV